MKWNACGRFACRKGIFISFYLIETNNNNRQWAMSNDLQLCAYYLFSHAHKVHILIRIEVSMWLNHPKSPPKWSRERAKELLMRNKVPVQVQNEPISIANCFIFNLYFFFFFYVPVPPVYRLHRLFPNVPLIHHECNVSVQKSKNSEYRNKYERI